MRKKLRIYLPFAANELKRQNLRSADEVYILTLSENGSVFCQAKEA